MQIIVVYEQLFIKQDDARVLDENVDKLEQMLEKFINELIGEFVDKIKRRISLEKQASIEESAVLVRALGTTGAVLNDACNMLLV